MGADMGMVNTAFASPITRCIRGQSIALARSGLLASDHKLDKPIEASLPVVC